MQTVLLVMVFVSAVGLVLGIGMWVNGEKTFGKRLDQLGNPSALPDDLKGARQQWRAKVTRVAAPMAWLSKPKEGWESSNLNVRFMQAGLRGPGWTVIFFGIKTFFTMVFPGVLLPFLSALNISSTAMGMMFALLSLAAFGYYLPNLVLAQVIRARQRELQESLPDAVDMIRICVEAGLGLDAAITRVGEEIGLSNQALAEELKLVALDLRIGSTREHALQNFALRTGVDDVATFVTILLQSARFGTNVGESLRVLSDTTRESRKVRAEKSAAKIPLKLLFPLIFLIFPSLFVVLLAPAFISIHKVLLPTLTGGN